MPLLVGDAFPDRTGSWLAEVGNISASSSPMVAARSLEKDSRLRDAIAVLEQASKQMPGDTDLLNYLARLQTLIGDHEEALATYGAVLEQDDSDPAAWILAAQLHRTLGRKAASVDAFRQAIARDPANAAAVDSTGRVMARNDVSAAPGATRPRKRTVSKRAR